MQKLAQLARTYDYLVPWLLLAVDRGRDARGPPGPRRQAPALTARASLRDLAQDPTSIRPTARDIGPMKTPRRPNAVRPPKTPRKTRSVESSLPFCPMRSGLRTLSASVDVTTTFHTRNAIAVPVRPLTKRTTSAGPQTIAVPPTGRSERMLIATPARIAEGRPAATHARAPDVPWISAQRSEPLKMDSSMLPSDAHDPPALGVVDRDEVRQGLDHVLAVAEEEEEEEEREDERDEDVEEREHGGSARGREDRRSLPRELERPGLKVFRRDADRVADPAQRAVDAGDREDVVPRMDVALPQLVAERRGRVGRLVQDRPAQEHGREKHDERHREGEEPGREPPAFRGPDAHLRPDRPERDRDDRGPEDPGEEGAQDDEAQRPDAEEEHEQENDRVKVRGSRRRHLPSIIRKTLIDWWVMRPAVARVPRRPPPPEPSDPAALSRAAVESARARGFAAAGVLAASRPVTWERFRDWLREGRHAEMAFLERDAAARMRFDSILPFAKSVVAVARAVPGTGAGNVAAYARGEDYHRVVRRHLKAVVDDLRPLAPKGSHFRVCVDTAPLLEREVAVRAGLGFIGKNGMLIVPGVGSHVVLGEILTDVTLAPSASPFEGGRGPLRIVHRVPRRLPDAGVRRARASSTPRKCLSYLTIEKRGPFTPAEEAALGGRLFGCDDCQDVCPFNASRERRRPRGGRGRLARPGRDPRARRGGLSRAVLPLRHLARDVSRPRPERARGGEAVSAPGTRPRRRRRLRAGRAPPPRAPPGRAARGPASGSSRAGRWKRERLRRTRS